MDGFAFDTADFCLDAVHEKESARTLNALGDIENKLYRVLEADQAAEELSAAAEVAEPADEGVAFRRFNIGYSAHTDGVDAAELTRWRSAFPYLRVDGMGAGTNTELVNGTSAGASASSSGKGAMTMDVVESPGLFNSASASASASAFAFADGPDASPSSSPFHPGIGIGIGLDIGSSAGMGAGMGAGVGAGVGGDIGTCCAMGLERLASSSSGLALVGRAILVGVERHTQSSSSSSSSSSSGGIAAAANGMSDEGEGEVLFSHGCLEEFISVHSEGHGRGDKGKGKGKDKDSSSEGDAHTDPSECRRAEVVGLLFDALWPQAVEAVRPIVRRTLHCAIQEGIRFNADPDPVPDKGRAEPSESAQMWFADDDDW